MRGTRHASERMARTFALGAATGAAVAYWLPATAIVSSTARSLFDVRATIAGRDAVGVTFDDGPHPQGTPAVLEFLARVRAPATFFLVGEQVERYPSLAAEITAAGHEVGVHCHHHRNLMRLTPRQVRGDLARAADVISIATGVAPRYYRPPFGILTAAAVAVARSRGWHIVLWRRDGADWDPHATPESITRRILGDTEAGDILLLHDADHYSAPGSWRRTVDALTPIHDELAARGLGLARLD